MKVRWILLLVALSVMLPACSKSGQDGASPEAWIQVEVSARQMPVEPVGARHRQEAVVLCSFAAPVTLDEGAGRAICSENGARLDMTWNDATRPPNQGEGVELKGFEWKMPNRIIVAGHAMPVMLSASSKDVVLRADVILLAEPVQIQSADGAKTEISVRGRWLATPPEVTEIRIGSPPPGFQDNTLQRPQVGPF